MHSFTCWFCDYLSAILSLHWFSLLIMVESRTQKWNIFRSLPFYLHNFPLGRINRKFSFSGFSLTRSHNAYISCWSGYIYFFIWWKLLPVLWVKMCSLLCTNWIYGNFACMTSAILAINLHRCEQSATKLFCDKRKEFAFPVIHFKCGEKLRKKYGWEFHSVSVPDY